MTIAGSLILALLLFLQTSKIPSFGEDVFNPREKASLATANSLDDRIKLYEAASRRILKTIRETARQEKSDAVPHILETWTSLLTGSLEDISANSKPKKKSKKLIKYEIQVRESINDLQDLKVKASIEQQDAYDSCIDQAETIRKKFIDIVFQP
jgi:hypothetical protein